MKSTTLIYLLFLLFSYSAQSKAIQCDMYLKTEKVTLNSNDLRYQVRDEIYEVAQEIRNSKPKIAIPFLSWKKKVVLKSEPVLRTLIGLYDSLAGLIENSDRTDVKSSAKVLQHVTFQLIQRYTQNGISYDWFQKLSFFHALHAEMLTSSDPNDYLYRVGRAIDYKEDFMILFEHPEDVSYSMGIDKYYVLKSYYIQNISVDFSKHYSNSNSLVVVPTSKFVDIETLFWLRARGIGVIRVGKTVDTNAAQTFERDFNTAERYYNKITSKGRILSTYEDLGRLKDFYADIEERISNSSNSKRERLIKLSVAFRSLSSNRLIFDSCESLGSYFDDILTEKNLKQRYAELFNLSQLLAEKPPRESEVRNAVSELKGIFIAVCK